MRIVFMGTPDYSVKTLESLINAGHDIAGVFVQPDKPVGRKQILTAPPVKVCALENNLPVFQPNTLRDGEALKILEELNPEVIVVVAYGKLLPKEFLEFPKYGCVNGHASLLPRHRGASPIQWSIVCGDKKTGVTTMLMDEGMDTGDILMTKEVAIADDDTGESLFEKLADYSADLMLETLEGLEKGTVIQKKQPEEGVSYAPILKKDMAHIDFNRSALEVSNLVRGFYSWPCAFLFIEGKRVKVISCKIAGATSKPAGTIINSDGSLIIACGDQNAVELVEIQPEGSKRMLAANWLCGHKISSVTVDM